MAKTAATPTAEYTRPAPATLRASTSYVLATTTFLAPLKLTFASAATYR